MQFTLHIDCTTAFYIYIYIYTYIWEDGEREHRRGYFYMYIASCTGLDRKCHQIFVAIFRLEQVSCWLFDAWHTLWKKCGLCIQYKFLCFFIYTKMSTAGGSSKKNCKYGCPREVYVCSSSRFFLNDCGFFFEEECLNAWFDWKKKIHKINNFQSILIKSSL